MARKSKKGMIISDLHCGHDVGLTYPSFDADRGSEKRRYHYDTRRYIWDWYEDTVKSLPRLDFLIVNGDAIEGKGKYSGGTECLTTDRDEQAEMAIAAINVKKAPKIFMSYGTASHTGETEDWEDVIARQVHAEKIGGEDTIVINNLRINYRHHISRSSIPHGRYTALAREKLWNNLWAERDEYPRADVLIRSHVHYAVYCGTPDWLALITPGLQGYGGKYGARRMSGTVDIGVTYFDIASRDDYKWGFLTLRMPMKPAIEL